MSFFVTGDCYFLHYNFFIIIIAWFSDEYNSMLILRTVNPVQSRQLCDLKTEQQILNKLELRTVPTIVTAHTFCASRDTQVSYGWCLLIQEYFCAV